MNKQIKQLVALAKKCESIAKEMQMPMGSRTDWKNEHVTIGIYCNDDFKTMAIYFSPVNNWKNEIEVALYSGNIKIPYHLTVSGINAWICLYVEFINDYLGIDKQEMAEKLKTQKAQELHALKMKVNELSIEIKNAENENN